MNEEFGQLGILSGGPPVATANRSASGVLGRPRVLFIYPFDAPFIVADLELLRTFCEVSALQVQSRKDYSVLVRRIRGSDILFSWFALPFAAVAGAVARSTGRVSIVAAGGWDVARVPEIRYGRPLTFRGRMFARLALSFAHTVLAFSESSAEFIRKIAPKSHVRIAYLGIDPRLFHASEKEDLVVTIANITRENVVRKGLLDFVQAARELPNVRFVLVGRHVDDAIEQLRPLAPPNLSFPGWLPEADLRDLLARAKAYVQASYTEGFGVALAEAMASGCVPVVTRRGAIPELVEDAGIYVEYGDPASLAAGVRSALAADFGSRIRDRVIQRFTSARRLETLREVVLGLSESYDSSTNETLPAPRRTGEEI